MGGARAAALLARSSSTSSALLSQHLSFRPLLSLRPCRGRASASPVRMASDAAPQKDSSPASAYAASSAGESGSSTSASSSFTSPSSTIDFLTLCHRLKITKRAGWVRHSIREPESVADHMYRMSVMALISSDLPGVDRESYGSLAPFLAALTPGVNIIRMLFLRLGIQRNHAMVKSMSRNGDYRELLKGPLYYACTLTLATSVFWRTSPIAIAAICNLCAGDWRVEPVILLHQSVAFESWQVRTANPGRRQCRFRSPHTPQFRCRCHSPHLMVHKANLSALVAEISFIPLERHLYVVQSAML